MEVEKESEIWYAMRATYRRELDAMRLLEKEKLGCSNCSALLRTVSKLMNKSPEIRSPSQ